jgi:hypothetical protein
MARVFLSKTAATEYTPSPDETLETIVATKCGVNVPPISVDEVTLFNWGTKEPKEVLRALIELVGCNEINEAQPAKSKLNVARGPGGGKILLPRVWKKSGLAYETVHKLVVKQQLPATAISITSLDKWFLPGDENCDIGYALEGLHDRALKVDATVYASNYAKATPTNDGEFVKYTFIDIPDTPIIKKSISADAAERSTGAEGSWRGESEAPAGVLKPRAPATRYINAASSPYTVTLRYYKSDSQKKAMLRMSSFWPQWSGTGVGRAVVDDSLKFKWTLKNCPAGMQGQFQIFDKDGTIVWRQALTPAECGNGDHEHNWTEGKPLITEAKMPYRVQIQVHTNQDTSPGLGLAGMHTEVRLYCHPDTGTFGVDHEQETQVLRFGQAPWLPGPAPAEDSAKGRKLRLAKAGYHPGPVMDAEDQDDYKRAICEFQRDHRKVGTTDRLRNDSTIDQDTKDAIAAQAVDRRPLLADSARENITAANDIETALNNNVGDVVVWVDDRHFYTSDGNGAGPTAPNTYTHMDLGDYRGGMGIGDGKQTTDKDTICRPWIPLEVRIPILRKGDALDTASIPAINDFTRKSTGPIRVDWTFRDLPLADNVSTALYQSNRARPKKFLTDVITALKDTHNGKDAFNCPDTCGGVRDANYYRAVFGFDNTDSLTPWIGFDDTGNKVVCSVAHDDLGQDAARVFDTHLGKAGAYFRPSIIAGDGYQFRAQVNFRDLPEGATHPNWKVLRDRYTAEKLPQAHGPKVRLWRKTSLRGYIPWEADADRHWGNGFDYETKFRVYFESCFVHFVAENTGAAPVFTPATLFPPGAGEVAYRTLISNNTTSKGVNVKVHKFRPAAEITRSTDYVWPWSTHKHLGINSVPPPGTAIGNYYSVHLYPDVAGKVFTDSWRQVRVPLVHEAIKQIEQTHAVMRGHTIGEFRASPEYWVQKYYCDTCATDQLLVELTSAGGSGVGEDCRRAGCAGHLVTGDHRQYTCNHPGCNTKTAWTTANMAGQACTRRCTGAWAVNSWAAWMGFKKTLWDNVTTEYKCSTCNRTISVLEPSNATGARAGQVCNDPCPGTFQQSSPVRTNEIGEHTDMMGLPAAGESMGGLWLFCTYGRGVSTWAHEIAHHKHLEHGPGGGGYDPAQHDSVTGTAAPLNTFTAGKNGWDRVCMMGYLRAGANVADLDRGYFCGKCILKLRGWIVETGGVNNNSPAGNVTGP